MTRRTQALGRRGEKVAELWLSTKGWAILDRRFRSGHRDIDLVAARSSESSRVVAFVEVKARSSSAFGGPIGAVNWKKQRELRRSAEVWVARFGKPLDSYRFDVIGVLFGSPMVRVQHIESAFLVPTRS
jgi:putative endonuclease